MNSVSLIGRMTKDIEIRYSANQTAIGRFSIAVDRIGRERGTDFINIIVFGKLAEMCERYKHKGERIGVCGRIQTGSYEKDGRKVYTTEVIADSLDFMFEKKKEEPEYEGFSTVETQIPF